MPEESVRYHQLATQASAEAEEMRHVARLLEHGSAGFGAELDGAVAGLTDDVWESRVATERAATLAELDRSLGDLENHLLELAGDLRAVALSRDDLSMHYWSEYNVALVAELGPLPAGH